MRFSVPALCKVSALVIAFTISLAGRASPAFAQGGEVTQKPSMAAVSGPRAETMSPNEKRLAMRLVFGLLSDSQFAYRPTQLDAQLAKDIFKRYLEGLDSGKEFFLQSDVDSFAKIEALIPFTIPRGQFQPAMDIYDTYKKNVNERVAYACSLLQGKLDFSTHDRFYYDREKATWSKSPQDLDAFWRKMVMNDWLRLEIAGKKTDDIRKTLEKRYKNIAKTVNELDADDLFQLYMESYTNAVDPHTDYFDPRMAENFNQQMSLSLQGIGAQLQKQDEMVVIREIIPGGPAAIDGTLKPGDRIVGVGQGKSGPIEDVIGWRIDDVVALIRGKKKTPVRLEYIPASFGMNGAHRTVLLIRQQVRLSEQAAKSEIITVPASGKSPERRIGVIKLPEFYQDFDAKRRNLPDYASATKDVAKLLNGFKEQKIDAVLLDLRNNGGGALDEAIEMTGLFTGKGPVVQVRESGGRITVDGEDDPKITWSGPMAVLVNRGSASASEIFSGAIQDYGRGLIIGETTFGKGTVQNIVDLDRWPSIHKQHLGQLKLTIAQFFRVSGSSTQLKGVVPDISFPTSIDAIEFGESTYKNALPWSEIPQASHTLYANFAPLVPQLNAMHAARVAKDVEFQWWQEDVAQFRKEKAEKSVSLNLKDRLAEREKDQQKQEQRQKIRRQLGLPLDPLADESDDGLTGSERDIARDTRLEKNAKKRPDPLLKESAAILADSLNVLSTQADMRKRVLLKSNDATDWTN